MEEVHICTNTFFYSTTSSATILSHVVITVSHGNKNEYTFNF